MQPTSDVFKDLCSRPRPRNTQGQHQGHSEAASTVTHDNEKYSVFDRHVTNITLVAYRIMNIVQTSNCTTTIKMLQLLF